MKLLSRNRNKTDGEERSPSVLSKVQQEMDSMFERFFRGSWGAPAEMFRGRDGWGPSVDVVDGPKDVTVTVELPGVDPGELDISLHGNTLVIAGEKRDEHEEKGKDFYRSERSFGSFRRMVELPVGINAEKVSAEHANGVLKVRLEKHESVKPRKITIR